jgi:tetratricopeptide (TPR) repeat protein
VILSANILVCEDDYNYLDGCLKSIFPVVDDINVGLNDTMSATAVEYLSHIFLKYKEKIHQHSISFQDFSQARNLLLAETKTDWVLTLDPDERIQTKMLGILKPHLRSASKNIGLITLNCFSPTTRLDDNPSYYLGEIDRVYRKELRYSGIIHESIGDDCKNKGLRSHHINYCKIYHLGYDISPNKMRMKLFRNLNKLNERLKLNPADGVTWYHLAQTKCGLTRYEECLRDSEYALALLPPDSFFHEHTKLVQVTALVHQKKYTTALTLLEQNLNIPILLDKKLTCIRDIKELIRVNHETSNTVNPMGEEDS